jgi:hypothetical protein
MIGAGRRSSAPDRGSGIASIVTSGVCGRPSRVDEPDRVRLTADVEGRAGEDQDAMHVIGIAGIDVIEIGGMLVLVPVDDHADAASAQESANLFEVRHIRERLQFLA